MLSLFLYERRINNMSIIYFGRKIFKDQATWYHTDYICRREVVEIGDRREMMRFIRMRPDPFGSPEIRKVVAR